MKAKESAKNPIFIILLYCIYYIYYIIDSIYIIGSGKLKNHFFLVSEFHTLENYLKFGIKNDIHVKLGVGI